MRRILLLFASVIVLTACKSKQQTAAPVVDTRPAWVIQKPIDPFHYIGIGVATIIPNRNDHIEIAKNNALTDLASEISIDISSSSVLNQVEQNRQFREDFRSQTIANSSENLEGFELVDTYENGNQLWYYYRLDKAKYEQIRQQRRQNALNLSSGFLDAAITAENQGNAHQSFIMYLKALEAIKSHFNEPLEYTYKGQNLFYGNHLISTFISFVNRLSVSPVKNNIQVKRGQTLKAEEVSFSVLMDGKRQSNIPLRVEYSGNRLKNRTQRTDFSGFINIDLDKIITRNSLERVRAAIAMEDWAREATSDPMVIQLISNMNAPSSMISIGVLAPIFYISSLEENISQAVQNQPIAAAFKKELLREKFELSDRISEADYILKIEAKTREGSSSREGFNTAFLDLNIRVLDQNNRTLYSHQENSIRGVQLDVQKAGLDAFTRATQQVEREFYMQMRRSLFD